MYYLVVDVILDVIVNCKALSPLKIHPREVVTKYVNYGLGNLIKHCVLSTHKGIKLNYLFYQWWRV